jgi:ribosomal protein S18 acetylase RimI-like enzyme
MGNHLVIRSARDEDRQATIDLWIKCGLTTSYNNPGHDLDFAKGAAASEVIVGLVDDKVAASVMVGHDGHRGWLYYVAVDPDQRGGGFGAAIVEAGENWLRSRQVPKVMLLIRETNTKVEAFYTNIGYETVPRIILQKWLTEP